MRQTPWLCANHLLWSRSQHYHPHTKRYRVRGWTNLSLAVGPEIHSHCNEIVDGRVGGLVEESGGEGGERDDGQADLERTVDGGAGQERHGPLEGKEEDAKEEVEDLEDREGLDGHVEVLGDKVPKDLWPEEALYGSGDLVWTQMLGRC